jgi:toxin ParE1/3/4
MARVLFAAPADADTAAILNYLSRTAGEATALKYSARFERLYDRLVDHPASGAPRPKLGRDIRIGVVSPYVIIYAYETVTDVVTILRIVHGRRRISGEMLPRPRPPSSA